ncbi:MAG: hypothetical protein EA370_04785 [Wenzhouxiangella sp.]|nr:MAG: hypothetical protein EA370_04785 [Wenzhouxiangella sp.]
MRTVLTSLFLILLAATLMAVVSEGEASVPLPAAVQANADEPPEDMRVDESPLEELDPREASWKTWLGPILIGIFGLGLVFLIRRFSRAEANRDVDPPGED